ncbi:MAG: hypothetical protein QF872_08060 [Gammaproteobacteria bacterium]|nr:hypothetical protein [Gammaproteobacteria bacterium]
MAAIVGIGDSMEGTDDDKTLSPKNVPASKTEAGIIDLRVESNTHCHPHSSSS